MHELEFSTESRDILCLLIFAYIPYKVIFRLFGHICVIYSIFFNVRNQSDSLYFSNFSQVYIPATIEDGTFVFKVTAEVVKKQIRSKNYLHGYTFTKSKFIIYCVSNI